MTQSLVTSPEADATASDPVAWLDAWRARAGGAADPVRLAVAQGLARRAAAQEGEARERLVHRMQTLLEPSPASDADASTTAALQAPAGALKQLASLVDRLGRMPAAPGRHRAAQKEGPSARHTAPRPLKSVAAFHGTWSRLRVEQRLRQALAQVPAAAGPLNSAQLVSRALHAMQELSPEYLDAFMSHVDTLLWLEQSSGAGDLRAVARAEPRRRVAAKPLRKG